MSLTSPARRRFFAMLSLAAGLCFVRLPAIGQGMGFVPAPPEAFANHAHVSIATRRGIDRPKQFSLASDLPTIMDQGHTGSCVGWSTAYYCYSTAIARQRQLTPEQRKDPRFLFSPSFIWHPFNKGDPEQGMGIYQGFDVLSKQGCATLTDMPWDEKHIDTQPDEAMKAHAKRYRARQTVMLFRKGVTGQEANTEKLRNWLWEAKQPFVVGIPVYEEFSFVSHDADFVYKPTDKKGVLRGGHAVCIVGYDEDKHAFQMVNSWSDAWANKGLIWLDEDFLTQNAIEGWGQRPGGPIARGSGPIQLTHSITFEPVEKQK